MKLLKIDGEHGKGGFFLNPKTPTKAGTSEPNYQSIETIGKQDVMDMLDFLLGAPVELDPYVEASLPNPVQAMIYKNLYDNLTGVLNSKTQILKEIDDQFSEAEKKYIEQTKK